MRTHKFAEGNDAFHRMMDSAPFHNEENPYPFGSEDYREWDQGFEDARHAYYDLGEEIAA